MSLKWSETKSESDLQYEYKAVQVYKGKLFEIFLLDSFYTTLKNNAEETRSFQRIPVAPLPKFDSKDGENLDLFFLQFEEVTSKFSYTEYDKLLLLK